MRQHAVADGFALAIGEPEQLAAGVLHLARAALGSIAQRTGETVRLDPVTGRLAKGSAGNELWTREYEKGWEMKV